MKRRNIEIPVLILNGIGIILLMNYASVYFSGSAHITDPDAMLVMQDWEAAGILLTAGTVPLFLANFGAYQFLWKNTVKGWKRLLFFLPALGCAAAAAHFWIYGRVSL